MSDPLEALRARFIDRSRLDLERLREGVQGEALTLLVHRLAGSAGLFGFVELGEAAGRVDMAHSNGVAPSRADWDLLVQALEALPGASL
ncbi:MAG: Hpt domain-containing protein [Caulobacteraceae bacterium]|nr:MAG: Hpt domain-containing protein [Caulobacteraceae bacterium]